MKLWIKNSNGKPDAILTFLTFWVGVMLLKYILEGLTLPHIGAIPHFDANTAMAVLVPLLGTYVARRHGLGNKAAASALPDEVKNAIATVKKVGEKVGIHPAQAE